MDFNELVKALYAVLFANGDPITIQRLCQTFDVEPEEIQKAASELKKQLESSSLELLTLENTYQLATRKQYAEYIKKAFDIKRKTPLSQAALEVLAVVA